MLVLNGGNDDGNGDVARLAALILSARALVVGAGDHVSAVYEAEFVDVLAGFLSENW